MRLVEGFPFSLTTASAWPQESIATTAQTLSLERPLLLGAPGSRSTRVSSKHISSIQTRPERITWSCQPLTVENTLWRQRNAVEWLTSQVSSMRRSDALWHMTSTILMILCSGSLAAAKTVPDRALNLAPHEGHRYRAAVGGRAVEPSGAGGASGADRRAAPLCEQALDRVRAVLLAAQPRRGRVPELVELGGGKAVHEGAQVEGTALHEPLRHSGSRLGGHLPECRQTKKKVASQAALFGGAIISWVEMLRHFTITTFVDPCKTGNESLSRSR